MATIDNREQVEAQIIGRAWKDEAFRQELLRDPKAALAREFGLNMPDGVSIQVHAETQETLHLVLPANPAAGEDIQLSDEELEAVAGGWSTDQGVSSCRTTCDTKAGDCVTGGSLCRSKLI